jgi:hypothetical protein
MYLRMDCSVLATLSPWDSYDASGSVLHRAEELLWITQHGGQVQNVRGKETRVQVSTDKTPEFSLGFGALVPTVTQEVSEVLFDGCPGCLVRLLTEGRTRSELQSGS